MVRVLVIAVEPLVRGQLTALIGAQQACAVVGEGDLEELESGGLPADVAVWDLGPDATEARRQLALPIHPRIPVVVLGPPGLMREALAWGAAGYLVRDPDGRRLEAAVVAAAEGLQVLDAGDADSADDALVAEALTPRELEVLQLLAQGLVNKAIAEQLRISENTVKFHVNAILGKLGARTRTEAVARAARIGLIFF